LTDETVDVEEMARLADLAVRVKRFLVFTVSAYAFYVYALGVLSLAFVFSSIAALAGLDQALMTGAGSVIGVFTASYVFGKMMRGAEAFASGSKKPGEDRRAVLFFLLLFASVFTVALIVPLAYPRGEDVGWYPGVAVMLLLLYLVNRSEEMRPHLYTSLFMLATSPLIVYYDSQSLAIGLMSLSYFIAGTHMTLKALRELGG